MRESGILMPISSLPSPYGIGTFGQEAFRFVDFLHAAGQRVWQILPLCPTGVGDGAYQSFSTFAGNPYFIDLSLLAEDGLLTKDEIEAVDFGDDPRAVDYGKLYKNRPIVWKKAFRRFVDDPPKDYAAFEKEQASWLSGYARFMALKDRYSGAPWYKWPEPFRSCKGDHPYLDDAPDPAIAYYKMLQYLFYKQWGKLKAYAAERGVEILGDLPIYVSLDSADVWCHPELFDLDEKEQPVEVAGCPPDAFSEDGQRWGNPLYDWDAHRKTGFAWWIDRLRQACTLYDRVRIDHFRGLEAYYCIPAKDDTARNGKWRKGPGMELFRAAEDALGTLPILAEDLGFLTPEVYKLLIDSGFPGMRVMQFAFSDAAGDSAYLPHNFIRHCVAYAGTHDNEPILAWAENASDEERAFAKEYLHLTDRADAGEGMIRALFGSVADLVVVQMQDWLGLGAEGRINEPSTMSGNWTWRTTEQDLTEEIAAKVYRFTWLYRRCTNT